VREREPHDLVLHMEGFFARPPKRVYFRAALMA
jgi:hypothetical protein